ncbi:MAG TPA: hypothetical protein VFB38_16115 [Chthonomonadaceae bacterium]|nr:hypothetical protein [Chthonomonadaceae bacterium]
MQGKIPPWLAIVIIVVIVALVGFFGYSQMKSKDTAKTPPPPWIDPVTNRPRKTGVGTGAPSNNPAPGAQTPATAPAGNGP